MTPQNDKLKSIIEEFREKWPNMAFGVESNVEFFISKLTEYAASEREAEKRHWLDYIEEKHVQWKESAHAAGREEAIREILEMLNREFDDLEKLGLQSLSGEVARMRINLLSLQKTSQEKTKARREA